MSGYELLDRVRRLAKINGWPIATRKGATSHLVVYLTSDRGERIATIPMHKKRDLSRSLQQKILKRLAIDEWEL